MSKIKLIIGCLLLFVFFLYPPTILIANSQNNPQRRIKTAPNTVINKTPYGQFEMQVIGRTKQTPPARTTPRNIIPGRDYVPGEVLVRFYDNVPLTRAAGVSAAHGLKLKRTGEHSGIQLLKIPPGQTVEDIVEKLNKDPNVKFAEPNYKFYAFFFPNDPYFNDTTIPITGGIDPEEGFVQAMIPDIVNNSFFFYYTLQPYKLLDMNMASIPGNITSDTTQWLFPGTWHFERGNRETRVAVLDTGVDLDHEDLRGQILRGFDYVDRTAFPRDINGHGTHVAGIIAAIANNRTGIIGMAPNVRIIPIRVLDDTGVGNSLTVAEGIIGAATRFRADIINMSLGFVAGSFAGQSQTVFEAVRTAAREGVHLVAAAGNDGINFNAVGETRWVFPAMHAGVISVGSWDYIYDATGPVRLGYSNYGYQAIDRALFDAEFEGDIRGVDIYAPGGSGRFFPIVSTWPYDSRTATPTSARYQGAEGTSMAAPHVSALVAMLMNNKGIQDRRTMLYALYSTSWDPITGNYSDFTATWSHGMIDPHYAITEFQPTINLSIIDHTIDDDNLEGRIGNANGILDPGETVDLTIDLMNTGTIAAADVSAILSSDDPYVTIIENFSLYNDILPGSIESNLTLYRISIAEFDIEHGYTIRLLLNVTFRTGRNEFQTVTLPLDIELSKEDIFVSRGGVYHQINFQNQAYRTIIDDNHTDDRTAAFIPGRTEADGAPAGNIIDNYLNPGDIVEMSPILINNTGVTFVGINTTSAILASGIYANLRIHSQYPTDLMNNPTDSFELYITNTTSVIVGGTGVVVGFVGGVAQTEFDYNFNVQTPPPPPEPEATAVNRRIGLRNHIPEAGFGQVIFEFDLRTPQDDTAIWIDRFPVTYALETALAFDHYQIIDINNNNIIEPGETIRLRPFIRNGANIPVISEPPVIAVLSAPDDPYVTISVGTVTFPTPGNKQTVGSIESGFEFTIAPDTPQNHRLFFNFTIFAQYDTGGIPETAFQPDETQWYCPFIVEMGQLVLYDGPNPAFNTLFIDTTVNLGLGIFGNGDGAINPGEEIHFYHSFWNRYYNMELTGLSVEISTENPFINITRNKVFLGDVGARSIVRMRNPFKFIVPVGFFDESIDFLITITDGLGNQYINRLIVPVNEGPPAQMVGFPYQTGAAIRSSPKLIDLNKDGITDILVGNENGIITAINLSVGEIGPLAGWPVGAGSPIRHPLAIGDIDNSGTNSVIAVPQNGRLFAWRYDGTPYGTGGLLVDLIPFDVSIKTPPVLVDLTGDGALDIVVGTQVNTATDIVGAVFAFDSTGSLIGLYGTVSTAVSGPIVTAPAVGNIFGDDNPEVVIASQSGEVVIFDNMGNRLLTLHTGAPNNSPPVIGDFDGNGLPNIILKAGNGNLYVWELDGVLLDGFPIYTGGSVVTPPALADINGDTIPEIIIGGTDSILMLTMINGFLEVATAILFGGGRFNDSQAIIADINQTPEPELIVTTSDGQLRVYRLSGEEIFVSGNIGAQFSTPAVGRFANPNAVYIGGESSNNAIIVTSTDGNIRAYISIFDSDPAVAFWPQYRRDPQNTGNYGQALDTFENAILWITNATPYNGIFDYVGDIDWLAFRAQKNHLYRIIITTPSGSTALPQIELYDTSGLNKLTGPTAPLFERRVNSTGIHYIRISNLNSNYGPRATYQITILDVTAITNVSDELWQEFY